MALVFLLLLFFGGVFLPLLVNDNHVVSSTKSAMFWLNYKVQTLQTVAFLDFEAEEIAKKTPQKNLTNVKVSKHILRLYLSNHWF